jgi:serine/threonine protein kinase
VTKQESPVTEQGAVVGTFQYMSPEQIEGKELDGRSDIFSLGAVFYEMVTGQRAFQGKSQLSVASAILEKEPAPISSIKPMTPPALDHAIRRCLAKDAEERWQSARDLALELKPISLVDSASASSAVSALSRSRSRRELLAWAVAATAFLSVLAFGFLGQIMFRPLRPRSPPSFHRPTFRSSSKATRVLRPRSPQMAALWSSVLATSFSTTHCALAWCSRRDLSLLVA